MADIKMHRIQAGRSVKTAVQTMKNKLVTMARLFRTGHKKTEVNEGQASFISITGQKIDTELKTTEITEDLSQNETQRQIDIHTDKVRTHVEQSKNSATKDEAEPKAPTNQETHRAPMHHIGNLGQKRNLSLHNMKFGNKGKKVSCNG